MTFLEDPPRAKHYAGLLNVLFLIQGPFLSPSQEFGDASRTTSPSQHTPDPRLPNQRNLQTPGAVGEG